MAEDTPPEVRGTTPQTASGETLAPGLDDAETLARALAEKETEAANLQKELLYQRAEFENFRKRLEKRYRDALDFAAEPLLKDLLPVLDNLERALAHGTEASSNGVQALMEGLGHVAAHLRQVLANHGVEDVPASGERFDPNIHEAIGQVPGELDNCVAEVFQKGYLLKGRLLRPAKVVISKVAAPPADG